MKLAKTIAIGAAFVGLAAGSALAEVSDVYGVDENRDGVIDSYLFLEESDTRA
jgi:hypothetical protein